MLPLRNLYWRSTEDPPNIHRRVSRGRVEAPNKDNDKKESELSLLFVTKTKTQVNGVFFKQTKKGAKRFLSSKTLHVDLLQKGIARTDSETLSVNQRSFLAANKKRHGLSIHSLYTFCTFAKL